MFDADVMYLTRWELSYSPRAVGMAAESKSVLYSYKNKKKKAQKLLTVHWCLCRGA